MITLAAAAVASVVVASADQGRSAAGVVLPVSRDAIPETGSPPVAGAIGAGDRGRCG